MYGILNFKDKKTQEANQLTLQNHVQLGIVNSYKYE